MELSSSHLIIPYISIDDGLTLLISSSSFIFLYALIVYHIVILWGWCVNHIEKAQGAVLILYTLLVNCLTIPWTSMCCLSYSSQSFLQFNSTWVDDPLGLVHLLVLLWSLMVELLIVEEILFHIICHLACACVSFCNGVCFFMFTWLKCCSLFAAVGKAMWVVWACTTVIDFCDEDKLLGSLSVHKMGKCKGRGKLGRMMPRDGPVNAYHSVLLCSPVVSVMDCIVRKMRYLYRPEWV